MVTVFEVLLVILVSLVLLVVPEVYTTDCSILKDTSGLQLSCRSRASQECGMTSSLCCSMDSTEKYSKVDCPSHTFVILIRLSFSHVEAIEHTV